MENAEAPKALTPYDLKKMSPEEIDKTLQQLETNELSTLGTEVGRLAISQQFSIAPLALFALALDKSGQATRDIMQDEQKRVQSWEEIESRFFIEYDRRSQEMRSRLQKTMQGSAESL